MMHILRPFAKKGLMDKICSVENMTDAWRQVRSNLRVEQRPHSRGVDMVSIQEFERNWAENMADLIQSLKDGSYWPMPLRRVEISKGGGGTRSIAILAVRDRIAQRAMLNVIEPLFEAQFLDSNYGFRPGRSAEDAVRRIVEYRAEGCQWVLDGDIKAFFDSIDQELLMRFVRSTIRDKEAVQLIEAWLEVGVMTMPAGERQSRFYLDGLFDLGVGYLGQALDWGMRYLVNRGERPYYPDEALSYEPLEADEVSARTEALKRLGADGMLLALALSRPLVDRAREGVPPLKHAAKRRGIAVAGLASLGAILLPLARRAMRSDEARHLGTPQGSPLSPLLANVYLHQFDLAMNQRGHRLVRYADDFVILCATEGEATRAWREAEKALARLRLELNEEKTRIVRFDDGFEFLGVRFIHGEAVKPTADASRFRRMQGLAQTNLEAVQDRMGKLVEAADQQGRETLRRGRELASGLIQAAGQRLRRRALVRPISGQGISRRANHESETGAQVFPRKT